MSKNIKDPMKGRDDRIHDFPPDTSASADLNSQATEDPSNEPDPKGAWHPTKAGQVAEHQGRTTQEGAAEQAVEDTSPKPDKKS